MPWLIVVVFLCIAGVLLVVKSRSKPEVNDELENPDTKADDKNEK